MEREPFSAERIKEILSKYSKEKIMISLHYEEHINKGKRDVKSEDIIEFIASKEPYFAEKQKVSEEIRYKIAYKLSSRYDLVAVVIEVPQGLKVITAYKSSKKVKESWQKKAKSVTKK